MPLGEQMRRRECAVRVLGGTGGGLGLVLLVALSSAFSCERRSAGGVEQQPRSTASAPSSNPPLPSATGGGTEPDRDAALPPSARVLAAPTASALAPLEPAEVVSALPVEGFRPAALALPRGITKPVPLVVALHGNYDRPEWQCETWADVLPEPAIVLCPRGVPRSDAPRSEDRWTYGAWQSVKREIEAGIAAVDQRYGDYIAGEHPVFLGFSLGAILGVRIVSEAGAPYRSAVLIEGGDKGWSPAVARRFEENGGERVLFACGQAACTATSRAAQRVLERAGVEARVVSGGSVGHTYGGSVARAVSDHWAFVIAPAVAEANPAAALDAGSALEPNPGSAPAPSGK